MDGSEPHRRDPAAGGRQLALIHHPNEAEKTLPKFSPYLPLGYCHNLKNSLTQLTQPYLTHILYMYLCFVTQTHLYELYVMPCARISPWSLFS